MTIEQLRELAEKVKAMPTFTRGRTTAFSGVEHTAIYWDSQDGLHSFAGWIPTEIAAKLEELQTLIN